MATFSANISADSDDAFQQGSAVSIGLVTVTLAATTDYGGFRFQNVTIPQGSTINSATMDMYVTSNSYDDPNVTIYCDDTDDAATFTTAANDISSRAATTATTAWSATGLGTGVKTTPDFAAAVQEVIARGGWASGNDLAVIFDGGSGCNLRVAARENTEYPPAQLNISYGVATGNVPVKARHYRGLR